MKRIIVLLVGLGVLAAAILAADIPRPYEIDKSMHGVMIIDDGADYIIGVAADTTAAFMFRHFRYLSSSFEEDISAVAGDSARVVVLLQGCIGEQTRTGGKWFLMDSISQLLKGDTLYQIKQWTPKLPVDYIRFIKRGTQAATESTTVYMKHMFQQ